MNHGKLSQQLLAHLAKVLGRPVRDEHAFVISEGPNNTMRILCNGIRITTESVTLLHNGVPVQQFTFREELRPTDEWNINNIELYVTVNIKTE